MNIFLYSLHSFLFLIIINITKCSNIEKRIIKNYKKFNKSNLKIKKTHIKKILDQSFIFNNNFCETEKQLLYLIIKNNFVENNYIINTIDFSKEFISLIEKNEFDINILKYDPKCLEEILINKIDLLDNKKIIYIINNLKELFAKAKQMLSFISNIENSNIIFGKNIKFIDKFIQYNFQDDVLDDTIYYLNNNEKLNFDLCFNKKAKIKYLICVYKNIHLFASFIYNYYIIAIKLKLIYNIVLLNKNYSYINTKKMISKNYINKLLLLKKRLKTIDMYTFIIPKNKNKYIKIIHTYKNRKNKYYKIKHIENIILGSLIGLTIKN